MGDGFADGAGAVHFRGLDAPLFAAPSELHQAPFGEAAVGNAAGDGGGDDGPGAGTQPDFLVEFAQAGQGGGQVEGLVVEGGGAEFVGQLDGQPADGFLGVFDHHLIDSGLQGGDRAAEGDRATGLGLQSEGGQFQRGDHRGPGLERADLRESFAQAVLEAGQVIQASSLLVAANDRLDGGMQAPEIGPAQCPDVQDVHALSQDRLRKGMGLEFREKRRRPGHGKRFRRRCG